MENQIMVIPLEWAAIHPEPLLAYLYVYVLLQFVLLSAAELQLIWLQLTV
ncbi:hypothetical protein L798_05731 [Zootermopsis nevadensis]|uniref:Uncharacterized protein n=1 Tax=Zootermopsis nevadensis TaxID=136037 RepID=A0A067RHU1_ZOONE|nr:hypothetical protein L798_05731 [Zootermopsis nevadensis]